VKHHPFEERGARRTKATPNQNLILQPEKGRGMSRGDLERRKGGRSLTRMQRTIEASQRKEVLGFDIQVAENCGGRRYIVPNL